MKVAVTADIHGPKYLGLLTDSLKKAEKEIQECSLFLLVGDIVLKNRVHDLNKVLEAITGFYTGKVLACFGNEEYSQSMNEYLEFKEITWLNDELKRVKANETIINIIGSRGCLDRPPYWQRTHVNNIWNIYREKANKIEKLLIKAKKGNGITVVLTHYAPTYVTLKGEKEKFFPEIGCRKLEKLITKYEPDFWFHGHAHKSILPEAEINSTKVLNVALPARKEIVVVDLFKLKLKGTLLDFI